MCPYQQSLLSFRMRSRSSMPNRASSSVDLMFAVSCDLTLHICLITALSFRCRRCRRGLVNGQVSLAWSIALRTQELYTRPLVLRERWRRERTFGYQNSPDFDDTLSGGSYNAESRKVLIIIFIITTSVHKSLPMKITITRRKLTYLPFIISC